MVNLAKAVLMVAFFTINFGVVNAYASTAEPAQEPSVMQNASTTQELKENPAEGPKLLKVPYLENNSRAMIPQLEGMQNTDLQATINNNLKSAIVSPSDSLQGNFDVSFYGDNLLGIHFWGSNSAQNGDHLRKIDKGIHIDLTNGKIYKLDDLFKANINFEKKIKEICLANDNNYRYSSGNLIDEWTHEEFANTWTKERGSFLLLGDSLIVYSTQSEGIIGYKIPYSDLKDIIDTDGELWSKIQGQKMPN